MCWGKPFVSYADCNGTWKPGKTWNVGQPVTALVPSRSGEFLAVTGSDVVSLDRDFRSAPFATLGDPLEIFLNDAKCDPTGRLVVGWGAADEKVPGGVMRVEPDGVVETIVTGIWGPNGLDWSPDGTTFYLVDTLALRVDAFDYDSGGGPLRNRRGIVEIERGSGAPDGMAVDHEGCLWIAIPYAGEVRRYGPDGSLQRVLEIPTHMPTSCAFGGPEGRQLFITSQSRGLFPIGEPNALDIAGELIEAGHNDRLADETVRL